MNLIDRAKRYIAETYTRLPIAFSRGEGVYLWDLEGKRYIDMVAGIAVLNLGHSHPRIVAAIKEQASRLMHTSNLYHIENQILLAEKLWKLSSGYKSFFCNSGAEAVEAALKLARRSTGRKEIIATENSFHGRTMGALSATGQEKYRKPFEPLVPGFKFVPYGSAEAVEKAITPETAAVIVEPIQGEGGVVVPPEGYLQELREICTDRDVLLIFDEVQTGIGRTGYTFAWQGFGVEPDIFTLAKALGSGFPIGAMLAKPEVMEAFKPGDHASTFGGNPLATRVALETLNVLEEENLCERSLNMGRYLMKRLEELEFKDVEEIRGRGLMIGVEFQEDCSWIVTRGLDYGVLLNCTHSKVLRLIPPLIIDRRHVDEAVEKLNLVVRKGNEG